MSPVLARASFCLAIFLILFVGTFAVLQHDSRTLTVFNHGAPR